MIDFNRLTNNAQEILFSAQQLMSKFQNTQMEPEHIVLAMEEDRDGISKDYLRELKLDNPSFRDALMSLINNSGEHCLVMNILDAAAMETVKPYKAVSIDWTSTIENLLSGNPRAEYRVVTP